MRLRLAVAWALFPMIAACMGPREETAHTFGTGARLFSVAFNPDLNFRDDLRPSSHDQLVLTAAASSRDHYAPAYSLAVAYRCVNAGEPPRRCTFFARILRVRSDGETRFESSMALLTRVRGARSAEELKPLLDEAGLEWLEADVEACDGGIFAMDSVRVADWRPDIHTALQPVERRQMILHPAQIWVRMTGYYTTSRYQGWVLADGVPAAVRRLLEVLEPCWRPASSPRPWER